VCHTPSFGTSQRLLWAGRCPETLLRLKATSHPGVHHSAPPEGEWPMVFTSTTKTQVSRLFAEDHRPILRTSLVRARWARNWCHRLRFQALNLSIRAAYPFMRPCPPHRHGLTLLPCHHCTMLRFARFPHFLLVERYTSILSRKAAVTRRALRALAAPRLRPSQSLVGWPTGQNRHQLPRFLT